MIGRDEIVHCGCIWISSSDVVALRDCREFSYTKLEAAYCVIMAPCSVPMHHFVQYSTHSVGTYFGFIIEDVFSFPRSIEHLFKGYESQIMVRSITCLSMIR